jgi:hypothetical protein
MHTLKLLVSYVPEKDKNELSFSDRGEINGQFDIGLKNCFLRNDHDVFMCCFWLHIYFYWVGGVTLLTEFFGNIVKYQKN